jgi:pyridoxine kinase
MKDDNQTSVIAYNRTNDIFWKVSCTYIPAYYPGTGDAFTSVMIGSLLQGDSLPIALERGVQFITTSIKASYGFDYPKREGVLLERVLDTLSLPVMANSYELME